MKKSLKHRRVLATYPYRRGFGFAVLEHGKLLDWGVARLYSKREEEFLVRVEAMIARYSINWLGVEEPTRRRSECAKTRIARLVRFGVETGVPIVSVSGATVRRVIGLDERAFNYSVSSRLAQYLPELIATLPLKRRFYEAEDDRSCVFRAVGIAVAALCS